MNHHRRRRRQSALVLLLATFPSSHASLRKNNFTKRSPVKWWYSPNASLPGGGECVQSDDYPPNLMDKFLYDSKDDCCDNHQDISCLLIVKDPTNKPTSPPIPVLTNEPTAAPVTKESKWYPLNGNCQEGNDYPDWMGAGTNRLSYLFDDKDDCCSVHRCSIKEEMWWPNTVGEEIKCLLSNTYPAEFMQHVGSMLFVSEEDCCAIYCGGGTTTTVAATTTPKVTSAPFVTTTVAATTTEGMVQHTSSVSVPGSKCPNAKWHVSTRANQPDTCINDDKYPSAWEGTIYLVDSAQKCCNDFFGDSCIIKDVCDVPDEVPGQDCPDAKWHMSTLSGGIHTCTNDAAYPSVWENMDSYLFDSATECCDRFFPNDCEIVDHCSCPKNWHLSITPGETETCTNDLTYPSSWHDKGNVFFFTDPKECCLKNFDVEECNLHDVCECLGTWHVNPENPIGSCSNGNFVPTAFTADMKGYESGDACCKGYFGADVPCEIIDKCADGPTVIVKDVKWWYNKDGSLPGGGECVYSDQYDDVFVTHFRHYLYDDKEACCENHSDLSCLVGPTTTQATEDTMATMSTEVGCAEGFCEDFDGECGTKMSCFIDPCEMKSCGENETCESNSCGGCNARCFGNTMTQNSAVIPFCPRGECHNPDGLCEAETFCAVDPCNGHECAFGEVCQTNMCGGCHAICARDPLYVTPESPTTTEAPKSTTIPGLNCPHAKWHISTQVGGAYTCTNDDNFPTVWYNIDGYLFESAKACCDDNFGIDCIVVDDCESKTPIESKCPEARWHISTLTGGTNTCTNDDKYPSVWENNGFLLPTAESCCEKFFPDECIVVENCPIIHPSLNCIGTWHVNPENPSGSCSNGNDAPSFWPDLMVGYASGEACCLGYYGDDVVCDIVDKCEGSEESNEKEIKWWYTVNPSLPGGGECVQSADYPDDWPTKFSHILYDDKTGCCDNHQDVSCLIKDPITTSKPTSKPTLPARTDAPTTSPTRRASHWFFDDASNDCIEGTSYPDWMAAGLNKDSYLFSSREDCCLISQKCTENEAKWWPNSNGSGGFECIFSNAYPNGFVQHGDSMLFNSEEDCCELYCGDFGTTTTTQAATTATDVATTTTTQETTTTKSPMTTDSGSDVFVDFTEGLDSFDDSENTKSLPWIFGSPEEWVKDTSRKLAGLGSLKNVAPVGNDASSTLTLKVRLPSYSLFKCYAYIDTAMPWDSFSLEVDGAPRYVSYSPSGDWMQVATAVEEGERTITLSVKNASFSTPGARTKGTGYVWLDLCEIKPMGS